MINNNSSHSTFYSTIYLPAIILIISFLTFYTYSIFITADMSWHINAALDLYNGKGFVDSDITPFFRKGPLWPAMICLSFYLFGVSPWSAFWMVRIFAIINPVLIYFLGKKLFNRWVGFTASLLILSSYSMNHWSYRHLDAVWPFFAISSIFMSFIALEKRSFYYFIFSGFLISVSYLIKQAAVLFIPLPFILSILINDYRNKKVIYGTLIYLFIVFLITSPWIYFVFSKTQNIKLAFLGSGSINKMPSVNPDTFQIIKSYILGIFDYYSGSTNSLSDNFIISPFFILAWLFVIYKAFQKDKGSILCFVCLLLLSPYISLVGKKNMRVGQLIILLLLNYMVLGYFLYSIVELISNKTSKMYNESNKRYFGFISVVVVSIVIVIQFFLHWERDLGGVSFFKKSFVVNFCQKTKKREVIGVINESMYKVANWINNNIPHNTIILGGSWAYNRGLYLLTEGKISFLYFPLIKVENLSSDIHNPSIVWENAKYSAEKFILPPSIDLLLFTTHGWDDNPRWAKAWLLYESHLLEELKKENIRYIIIGPIFNFLTTYFEKSDSFAKIASFNNGSDKVFKVKGEIMPYPHNIYITRRTISCLNTLKEKDSKSFIFITKFLKEKVGFENAQIDSILSDQLTIPFKKVRFVKR